MTAWNEGAQPVDLDGLLTWREASTSGAAIEAALDAARSAPAGLAALLDGADRIILSGAGSSYYLARVAAAVAREATGRVAIAVPLSELILRSSGVWKGKPGWESDPDLARANLVLTPRDAAIASLLRSSSQFQNVYEDSQAVIFQRRR